MAELKTTIETIFLEAAKVLGKAEAQKLLATLPEPKQEDEKPIQKAETSESKPTKRISRMTPTIANQLRAELVKGGVVFTDDEKKEFDKLKKEFVSYVDGLTNDQFIAKGLVEHMSEFANNKKVAPAKEAKPKVQKKSAKDKQQEIPKAPTSNAGVDTLSLEELQAIQMIVSPDDSKPGLYWDGDEGRWVTGPKSDDEDSVEKKFKGKNYAIGEKTGRVYEITSDDKEVFAGYIGVGVFADLKMN